MVQIDLCLLPSSESVGHALVVESLHPLLKSQLGHGRQAFLSAGALVHFMPKFVRDRAVQLGSLVHLIDK